jgi:L-gulonolactone oxidase
MAAPARTAPSPVNTRTNWARNQRWTPAGVAEPKSAADLVAVVTGAAMAGRRVKAIGAGHSFTGVAATDGVQVVLDGLTGLVDADPGTGLVTLLAGTRLRDIPALLAPHGLAMANLGDIDEQSIAGAISTGTHGTGAAFGGLTTQVRALELAVADGSLLSCDATHRPELFEAARLGLGALGLLATVTLQCVPAFRLRAVERPVRLAEMLDTFDELSAAHDHAEFYWFPHTTGTLYKQNTRLPADAPAAPLSRVRAWWDDEFLSNTAFSLVTGLGHRMPGVIRPLAAVSARALGARTFTDDSATVFTARRAVRFCEMEWALPRAAMRDAVTGLRRLIERNDWRISFPVEVRTAAADDVWLSTAQGRDSVYVAVHQYYRSPHEEYFHAVQDLMLDLDGRPHWGKMHYLDAESLSARYPHHADFRGVRDAVDPGRMFANPYLDRILGP